MNYSVNEKFIPIIYAEMKESVLSNPIMNLTGKRFDRYDQAVEAAQKAIGDTDRNDLLFPDNTFDIQIEKVFQFTTP